MRVLRIIAGLNPVALAFGPVFDKEVRVSGRQRLTYLGRFAFVALLTGALGLAWLAVTAESEFRGAAGRAQQLSALAPAMALVVGWIQFVGLTMLAPALTAPTITEEKMKRTQPALATTPLSAAQIVFSKMTGRMLQVGILAAATVPVLLFLRVFGGLEALPVLAMLALTGASAWFSGSLGMLFAIRRKRPAGAMLLAGFIVCAVYMWPPVTIAVIQANGMNVNAQALFNAMLYLNPVVSMGVVTANVVQPGSTPFFWEWAWAVCAGLFFGAGLMVNLVTIGLLRPLMLGEGVERGNGRRKAKKGEEVEAAAKGRSRVVGDNPVRWREVRSSITSSKKVRVVGIVIVGALLALMYTRLSYAPEDMHVVIGLTATLLTVLSAAMSAGGSIAGEKESRTWGVLVTTPLSVRRIIYSKWLGVVQRSAIIPALAAIHFLAFVPLGQAHLVGAVNILFVGVGFAMFIAGVGMVWSVVCNRSGVASAATLATALALWLALPLLTMMFVFGLWNEAPQWLEDFFEFAWTVTNPVALGVANALWAYAASAEGNSQMVDFGWMEDLTPLGFFGWAAGASCVAGALGFVLTGVAARVQVRRGLRGK
ncbi:MAG: ABC transporter permease subunit [Planctomycetota bacterium]|nr:ABC transporter permease subunit [Planctomycetota bacterium]